VFPILLFFYLIHHHSIASIFILENINDDNLQLTKQIK